MILQSLALDALRTSWGASSVGRAGRMGSTLRAAAGLPGPSDRGGSGYRLRAPVRIGGSVAGDPGRVPVILGSGCCARGLFSGFPAWFNWFLNFSLLRLILILFVYSKAAFYNGFIRFNWFLNWFNDLV